jgi:hypothetical protein
VNKKAKGRLNLSKETLRKLDDITLKEAAGGGETLTEPSCRGTNICTNCTACATCFATCQAETGVCYASCGAAC